MGKFTGSGGGGGGSIDAATSSAQGKIEIATSAETTTGTDAVRAVTPAGLHGGLVGLADATITASDKIVHVDVGSSNALKTDTVQGVLDLVPAASASTAGLIELATDAETLTGTATNRAITPANLLAKVNSILVQSSAGTQTPTAADSGAVIFLSHGSAAVTLPDSCVAGTHFTIINNNGANVTVGLNNNGLLVSGLPNAVINDHMSKTFICVDLTNSNSTWAVIG